MSDKKGHVDIFSSKIKQFIKSVIFRKMREDLIIPACYCFYSFITLETIKVADNMTSQS